MAEAPEETSSHKQPACVRPQSHAPLAALLSALATFNGSGEAPLGSGIGVRSDNRAKSAFAPISSQANMQTTQAAPGSLGPIELPLHLKLAIAQMNTQSGANPLQEAGSSCQLDAIGSRPMNIPSSKIDPEDSGEGDDDQDTSSNQAITTASPTAGNLSAEAKRKRRQEINRESARRVRKRKSEAHKKLQEEVATLKSSLAAITADQTVIVRYASELFKERESILRRATELESKWVTAECQLVVLRQQVTDLQSKLSQAA